MAARRKSAKKKVAKKKSAKKKAARRPKRPRKPPVKLPRRPRRKPRKPRRPRVKDARLVKIVIFRRDDVEGKPLFVDVRSAQASVGRGDCIVWFNSTGEKVVIKFRGGDSQWPFQGTKQDIVVTEYNESTVYYVRKKGEFAYYGEPPISGPPGDPVVDAGD